MLVGLHLVLAFISPGFAYGGDLLQRPILRLVGIEALCGILYLIVVPDIRRAPRSKSLLVWVIVVGSVLRLSLLFSTPMLEDDYYRYLWDGAVVANGINPYAYAPDRVVEGGEDSGPVPSVLHELASQSGVVASRVNHPHLRTVYPPTAQAAFALAYWLRPWSITALRLVLLAFDLAALGILIVILRTLGLPLLSMTIYWWNPVLIKEIFNSTHMDVVVLPFVLGAVLLAVRRRHVAAAGALALATGAKLWPVVLLPVVLRPILSRPSRLIPALCLFGLVVGAIFVPVVAAGGGGGSGLTAFGQRGGIDAPRLMVLLWGGGFVVNSAGLGAAHARFAARVFVSLILIVWIAWLIRRESSDPADFCERCLLIVAAVFLFSPAQFPHYYIWIVPFLAIRPRASLLLLTVLLPLYYLRFYLYAHDKVNIFDYGVVWLEYVPVWCLLIREWRLDRRHRPLSPSEAAA